MKLTIDAIPQNFAGWNQGSLSEEVKLFLSDIGFVYYQEAVLGLGMLWGYTRGVHG